MASLAILRRFQGLSSSRGLAHKSIDSLRCYLSTNPPKGTDNQPRLRRPAGYQQTSVSDDAEQEDPSKAFGLRSNTVTLFPGDFRDHDSMWEDEMSDDTALFEDDGSEHQSAADLIQQALREKEAKNRARKEKWIESSKPPVRVPVIDERGRAFGKGGRKTARATVTIQPGLGEIVVNRLDFIDYFERRSDRDHILAPLVVTETLGSWDVQISVNGGGLTGQAGAARLGLANALNAYNPDLYRPPLKLKGFLERDSRIVERKKIGHVKARKSPQWVRR
jgi:small subunit ribosomal protein S9